jgi:putative hydrolase of the HAD superfamily
MEQDTIRAVFWDLGGVILRTEDLAPREAWARRFGMDPRELSRLVFRSQASARASLGEGSVDEVWQEVQERLDLSDQDLQAFREDFFSGDEVDRDLLAFIDGLRPERQTGLISNAWPDTRAWLQGESGVAEAFDHIVISSEVGLVKPDPRIYRLALDALEVRPHQALLVDDFIENVEAAQAIGMVGIHFHRREEAILQISAHLH